MAKTARRSVTSNPSSLTSSASQSGNYPAVNSSVDHQKTSGSNNSSSPSATTDPLRPSGYQFTTHTASNYTGRHGNRSNLRSFNGSSSGSSNNSENINVSNNATTTTATNSTSSQPFNSTEAATRLERERVRIEFYATYDVMTGVRIAATLGGFFGLMVFLVVYKSRSHSNETLKVLKDPKIAAVAAACMQEEEDREIQEAMDATGLSIYPDDYDHMFFRRQRLLSLGNVSAPPVLHRNFRFSSVGGGGYSSLLEPPRRYSYSGGRRKSGSESSRILSAYPMGSSFGTDDYFIETDDELENEFDRISSREDVGGKHHFLEVPIAGQESRRSSGMTCCSTESSYLERRCSAITLGLSTLQRKMPIGSASRRSSTDLWDYYYPDIQIINPTPKTSPCPSERNLCEKIQLRTITTATSSAAVSSPVDSSSYYNPRSSRKFLRKASFNNSDSIDEENPLEKFSLCTENRDNQRSSNRPRYDDNNELKLIVKRKISDPSNNNHIYSSNNNSSVSYPSVQYQNEDTSRRAPLASLSSFKISSVDYQDSDLKSLGSDSVFVESYADTDDDMEQFSTDSDEISISIGAEQTATKLRDHVEQQQQNAHKIDICHTNDSNKKLCTNKRIRPSLERHRTISITSNDRDMLISQQSQDHLHYNPDDHLAKFNGKELTKHGSTSYTELPMHQSGRTVSIGIPISASSGTSSTLNTELQRPTTSFSYDNNNDDSISRSSNRFNKIDRTKHSHSSNSNCENVEVNVIIENRPTISPSVILELPVIALPSQGDDDPPRDPSLPGTSRKWSKETLF